mmetsp:Transcript_93149/g.184868  ORF Transcript_93149/g.184868 Transcript_93149/m.184868 type:complete len:227 (-) Transcript_93149:823-1503(-)
MLPALSSGGGFLRKTPLSAGTAVLFGSAASGGKTAFAVGGRSCTGEAGPSTDVAASGACLPESAGSASAGADGNVALAACWDEVRVLLRLAATSPTAGGSVHECATLAKPQHWNQDSTVLYAWNATLAPPQSFGFFAAIEPFNQEVFELIHAPDAKVAYAAAQVCVLTKGKVHGIIARFANHVHSSLADALTTADVLCENQHCLAGEHFYRPMQRGHWVATVVQQN